EAVLACTDAGIYERPAVLGVRYKAFVDAAGGSGTDSFTCAIAHREKNLAVLDAIREIRPPFNPTAAVAELVPLLQSYKISSVVGDRYAGEWPREQFRLKGVKYELSERPKNQIYIDTLPLVNARRLALLDNNRLVSQLCGL